jgi:CheY-like chemotaxis protein
MDAPNGHKRKLRIILVEDDPNDIELTQLHLRTYRITCEIVAVDTKPAFESELERKPDLILSNLNLVRLDGLSALAIAAKKCPRTPFVFLSGTMREEARAVASVRGATDFVLKQDTEHLVSVIRRVCLAQLQED